MPSVNSFSDVCPCDGGSPIKKCVNPHVHLTVVSLLFSGGKMAQSDDPSCTALVADDPTTSQSPTSESATTSTTVTTNVIPSSTVTSVEDQTQTDDPTTSQSPTSESATTSTTVTTNVIPSSTVTSVEDQTPTDDPTTSQSSTSESATTSTTVTTNAIPSSTVTSVEDQTQTAMCPCSCDYMDKVVYWRNEKNQLRQYYELSERLAQLKRLLSVNTKNISSTINKKISADDDRPSASVTGYVGVVFIALFLAGMAWLMPLY
ncbi:uncharacterized protein LOC134280583 isoform X2 [Saccostrea cucullata]|uniref:uncharacterized protein LOC134280583 isoform X2 n=1 Tax=Saccostrea cuccullata TaxID=36930 RepID=UPI002ED4E771